MLHKYDINRSLKYNYRYTSKSKNLNILAENILKDLKIDKTKKIDLKRQFLINALINLKVADKTNNYISYNRKAKYYSFKPTRYRYDYEKYNIAIGVMNSLESAGLVKNELGFKNLKDGTGRLSKCIPTDLLAGLLKEVTPKDFIELPSKESIILKARSDKRLLDYPETKKTIQMRRLVDDYNTLRQKQNIQLNKLTMEEINLYSDFLFKYANEDDIKPAKIINLKNPYVYRVFNDSFKLGGRFYNGIETNMPKELRKKILINGHGTIEMDFNSMHIRMLYHLEGIDYGEDAYDELSKGNALMRKVYKLIGLTVINSRDMKSCVLAIRKGLIDKDLNELLDMDISDSNIKRMIENWNTKHEPISKYFNKDMGIKLQNLDSEIAVRLIEKFIKQEQLIMCIHDSFIVAKNNVGNLTNLMNSIYENTLKYLPKISGTN